MATSQVTGSCRKQNKSIIHLYYFALGTVSSHITYRTMSIRLGATALLGLAAAASAATTNTNLQTAFPASSGTSALAAVQTIAAGASFDGGMIQWDRNPSTCNEQAEGGDSDAVFLLEDGATLSNAIIGEDLFNIFEKRRLS